MYYLVLYCISGIIAGFFSGLLGIGGGLVVVPVLILIFDQVAVIPTQNIMQMAVATSLACMVFTTIASARAHAKKKTVLKDVVKAMMIPVMLGTFSGSYIASLFSVSFMRIFFTCYLFFVATQIFLDYMPYCQKNIPGVGILRTFGLVIGVISGLVGLGGGSLFVPFLRYFGTTMHVAVGTSAGLAWSISASGTIGYMFVGYGVSGLPALSIGYIYLPAFLAITIFATCTAPFGVKIGHALPVQKLRKIFAIFLYITAIRMLYTII